MQMTPDALRSISSGLPPRDRRRLQRLARLLDIAGVRNGADLERVITHDALIRDEISHVRRLVEDEGDGGHPPVYL
jgi:hypothetical protein